MTVFALICVDKFGRRRLLFIGAIIMGLSIFTLGIVCHFERAGIPNKTCVDHSDCQNTLTHNHSFSVSLGDLHKSIVDRPELNETTLKPPVIQNGSVMTGSSDVPVLNNSHNQSYDIHSDGKNSLVSENKLSKADNSSHSSSLQRILGFSALMCYVAAYGFSFGPGKEFVW